MRKPHITALKTAFNELNNILFYFPIKLTEQKITNKAGIIVKFSLGGNIYALHAYKNVKYKKSYEIFLNGKEISFTDLIIKRLLMLRECKLKGLGTKLIVKNKNLNGFNFNRKGVFYNCFFCYYKRKKIPKIHIPHSVIAELRNKHLTEKK
jgi:hypothetical protein